MESGFQDMIKVHVNRHKIAANAKHGTNAPPIAVRRGSKVEYAHEVKLTGAVVVYRPDRPLKCGAKVWIEAESAEVVS